jgi:hypothetical protein
MTELGPVVLLLELLLLFDVLWVSCCGVALPLM